MVFMQTYNKFTGAGSKQHLIKTEAEAKEWLVSEVCRRIIAETALSVGRVILELAVPG